MKRLSRKQPPFTWADSRFHHPHRLRFAKPTSPLRGEARLRPNLPTTPEASAMSVAPHGPRDFAFGVALGDRFSLVVLLLAPRQANLHLGVVAREVHAQRNQRVALLAHLADEARDLLAMQ